jgi:putative ATP-dependent endonuclease of OLD family
MRLHQLKIIGYKRLENIKLLFNDATFLIGQNNTGKSSILKAIGVLLSATKQLQSSDFYSIIDEDTGETKPKTAAIILEGEFRNLPEEAKEWRGFKGRIFEYESDEETGLSVTYKKTYELGKDVKIEFKSKIRELNPNFENCKKGQDYIDKGLDENIIKELFPELEKNIGKTKGALEKLDELDKIWDIVDEDTWFHNPGGIPGNVLKMLPRYLLIPVDTSINEIQGSGNGVLGKTLNELFQVVRENSENFKEAQTHLEKLAKELDPKDENSEFGKMMKDLNNVLTSIFPQTQLHASTDLSDPNKVLKPIFNIEMSSNIKTSIEDQGTGMVRATVFGMLRFRQNWLSNRDDEHNRSLIICFEEPEIYLHPSAANQMRNAIYDLSGSNSQIVASTHSPFLIDISRKPKQVLNRLITEENTVNCNSFSVSKAFKELQDTDKTYVKMLLKIDDYIARAFFANYVVIVEGDTEDILLRETISRLPRKHYLDIISNFEIIKARGKASIIGLVKYLTSMGIKPIVIHDRDNGIENATKFNEPIRLALNGNGRIVMMHENVEDEIGYVATYEKPFKAFQETENWGENWEDIPENWRTKVKEVFGEYIP